MLLLTALILLLMVLMLLLARFLLLLLLLLLLFLLLPLRRWGLLPLPGHRRPRALQRLGTVVTAVTVAAVAVPLFCEAARQVAAAIDVVVSMPVPRAEDLARSMAEHGTPPVLGSTARHSAVAAVAAVVADSQLLRAEQLAAVVVTTRPRRAPLPRAPPRVTRWTARAPTSASAWIPSWTPSAPRPRCSGSPSARSRTSGASSTSC